MRDGGRLAAAMDVLADMEAHHRPAALALRDWGARHRFAGSGDRSVIGNLVYDALRGRGAYRAALGAETPRADVLGAYVWGWGRGLDGLRSVLDGDPHAPAALTPEEEAVLGADLSGHLAGKDLAARASIPALAAAPLERVFGDAAEREARAMMERAPLDLRVNTLKADTVKALKALARFGAEPAGFLGEGLRIPAPAPEGRLPNLQGEPAFAKGWVEIQDEGSQIAARLALAEPGQQVLDYCAGAGGKTLALAALMDNKGQLFAHDADRHRMADLWPRLSRAGVRNTQILTPGDPALSGLRGRMHRVVVDAPCTGSGTWRRGPDTKWRLSDKALATRMAEQDRVLAEAAPFTAPGGRLVYITCSLFAEENEDRIEAFLETRAGSDFTLLDAASLWSEALSVAAPEGSFVPVGARGTAIRLTPARHGTDGFFIAVLERAGRG
ncbi:MAG: RsmB/NOP family class I SAM-dependent RNA methyltransferase [Hyphomicrobiaceae bacterium]|nr:RsmB/NOP family class I SAM-dependent RNA methyltransferase [Hyphomicrobiaceae bacterium]